MFKEKDRFKILDHVMSSKLENEIVIYNNKTMYYYSLNEIGTDIFKLIEKGLEFSEIVKEITGIYDADPELIKGDIEEIIKDLISEKIIKKDETD